MYNVETDSWKIIAQNPEMMGYQFFSVVHYHHNPWAFGGSRFEVEESISRDVYRLRKKNETFTWSKFEEKLMSVRHQHTSIQRGNTIIHIGGHSKEPYEVWEEDDDG